MYDGAFLRKMFKVAKANSSVLIAILNMFLFARGKMEDIVTRPACNDQKI